jgi:hypothetical protein
MINASPVVLRQQSEESYPIVNTGLRGYLNKILQSLQGYFTGMAGFMRIPHLCSAK